MRITTSIKNIIDKLHEVEELSNYEHYKQLSSKVDLEDNIDWINYSIREFIIPETEKLLNIIKRDKR